MCPLPETMMPLQMPFTLESGIQSLLKEHHGTGVVVMAAAVGGPNSSKATPNHPEILSAVSGILLGRLVGTVDIYEASKMMHAMANKTAVGSRSAAPSTEKIPVDSAVSDAVQSIVHTILGHVPADDEPLMAAGMSSR